MKKTLFGQLFVLAHLLFVSEVSAVVPDYCKEWFAKSKIQKTSERECVAKCVTLSVDMGTFDCPSFCDELCGRDVEQKYNPFYICPQEGLLVLKHSKLAREVYLAFRKAIALTKLHFKSNRQDDESDAFRHFEWGALSAKAIGSKLAAEFLEAHESCETEEAGQEMDRANNKRAIEFINKNPNISEDEIVKQGLKKIQNRELIVIKPRRKR